MKTYTINKCGAKSFDLKKGQKIKIDQTLGPQMAVLVAFNLNDRSERFSPGNTRVSLAYGPFQRRPNNGKIPYWVEKEDILISNRWNEMLIVEEDTFGKHDIIFDPCDKFLNVDILGRTETPSGCRELHATALSSWNIGDEEIGGGINIFQNTHYHDDGMVVLPTETKNEDFIVFSIFMDLLVSITACPAPLGENRPVRISVY